LQHPDENTDDDVAKERLRKARAETDNALAQLRTLADEFERTYPGPVGSLRDGIVGRITQQAGPMPRGRPPTRSH
jgi:hypothetical protein